MRGHPPPRMAAVSEHEHGLGRRRLAANAYAASASQLSGCFIDAEALPV